MQTKITIRNEAQTCYIDIEGVIGVPEQNQFENASSRVATFETFRREVERRAQVAATSVVVNIRSTGGDVNDALLIYEALQGLDARITTRCYGYTASAATIIAQAADKGCREISSNALYLIHNSMCAIEGNASTLESRAELLRKTDERLAHLYAQHSGREAENFVELMAENNGEGRWLTAEETVAAGLADCITDPLITGVLVPEKEDTPSDVDIPQVENSAASEIIRYLLGRLAYRIEEWLERLHEKHMEKREAKRAEKEATQEQETLPQAAAQSPTKSIVTFEEGQRRYSSSKVKPAEDPSMNQPLLRANGEAYAADAKAFGKY
jgi:ATP-dependent protease ClpP protease subunit